MEQIRSWGYHLMLDCKACDIPSIMDYDNVYKFAKQLVEDIEMVALRHLISALTSATKMVILILMFFLARTSASIRL